MASPAERIDALRALVSAVQEFHGHPGEPGYELLHPNSGGKFPVRETHSTIITSPEFDGLVGKKTEVTLETRSFSPSDNETPKDKSYKLTVLIPGVVADPRFARRPGARIGDVQVGSITWDAAGPLAGKVGEILVAKEFQRKGVATTMWSAAHRLAKERGIQAPKHSTMQTPDGKKWAESKKMNLSAHGTLEFINLHTDREKRDFHGRFSKTLGERAKEAVKKLEHGESKEDPIHAKNLDEAAKAIADGRHVELKDAGEVYTLLDKLAAMALDAESKGKKAPNYDLCKVSVKGTNLFCDQSHNIARIKMPQLAGVPRPGSPADKLPKDERGQVDLAPLFLHHLAQMGITATGETVPAASLRATQRQLAGVNVARIMNGMQTDPGKAVWKQPLFVSRDSYVVDGHHRWAGAVGVDAKDGRLGDTKINVVRVNMPILRLLVEAKKFTLGMGIGGRALGEEPTSKPT